MINIFFLFIVSYKYGYKFMMLMQGSFPFGDVKSLLIYCLYFCVFMFLKSYVLVVDINTKEKKVYIYIYIYEREREIYKINVLYNKV